MSRSFFRPLQFAIKNIAVGRSIHWAKGLFVSIFSVAVLTGCSALPDKPQRAVMYDFGPGVAPGAADVQQSRLAPIALGDVVTAGGVLDNTAVLYRLAYVDAQQLLAYSQARWVMPPSQLLRQRLRDKLSERRTVFGAGESASLNRSQHAVLPRLLRLELEEFSHLFTAPDASVGLIRLRATLLEITPAGEKLIGQRSFTAQLPASSADAPGGVRALTEATDAAIAKLDQWLQQASGS